MLKRFMESSDLRKYLLLEYLINKNQSDSIRKLSEFFEVSEKTIISTVDNLQSDLEKFQLAGKIEIDENRIVIFSSDSSFSLMSLNINYVNQSVPYRLLDSVFKGEFTDMKNAAETLEVGLTTLYRRIGIINEVLAEYSLYFDTKDPDLILGNEDTIRFFIFEFYWNYQEYASWSISPKFSLVSNEIFYELMEQEKLKKSPLFRKRMKLWLEIVLQRSNDGFIMHGPFVERMHGTIDETFGYQKFKGKYLSNDILIKEECEIFFLFIVMITDPHYSDNTDYLAITMRMIDSKKAIYEKLAIEFIHTFITKTNGTMTDNEFIKVYQKLLSVNLQMYSFNIQSMIFENDYHIKVLEQEMARKLACFTDIYETFFSLNPEYAVFKGTRLFYQYLNVLFTSLSNNFFYHKIQVSVAISIERERYDKLVDLLFHISPIPLKVLEPLSYDQADLVILAATIPQIKNNIFLITDPLLNFDFDRLRIMLLKIAKPRN